MAICQAQNRCSLQNDRILGTGTQQEITDSSAGKLHHSEKVRAHSLSRLPARLGAQEYPATSQGVKKSTFRASIGVWHGTRHLSLQHYALG